MKKNSMMLFLLMLVLPIYCFSIEAPITSSTLKSILLEYGYKEIPIRLSKDKNYLLLDIALKDKKIDNLFVLDTGATSSSIDQQLQDKYKFKTQGKSSTSCGAGGGCFTTYTVMIPKMKIGSFTAYNQLAGIEHYSHIIIDKKHIAGMLGLDFLRKNHAILDVKNHRIFIRADDDKSSITQERIRNILTKKSYRLVQLKRSTSGHQTLLVKINNEKPVQFMLDSGVPPSVMLDYKYAISILGDLNGKPTIGKGSSNAEMKIYTATINKLSIDDIVNGPQPVVVTTGLEFAKIGIPVLGVIGLNWMLSHEALIDTSADFLFVKNNG